MWRGLPRGRGHGEGGGGGYVHHHLAGHQPYAGEWSVGLSRDGSVAAASVGDRPVRVWRLDGGGGDADDARTTCLLRDYTGEVQDVALAADAPIAVTALSDGNAVVWDVRTGAKLLTLRNSPRSEDSPAAQAPHELTSVAVAPDGSMAVTGSRDGTLCVWNLTTGNLTLHIKLSATTNSRITAVALSADKRFLAFNSGDASALRDATKGDALTRVTANLAQGPKVLALSPDASLLLNAGLDSVCVWDTSSPTPVAPLYEIPTYAQSPYSVALAGGSLLCFVGRHNVHMYHLSSSPGGARHVLSHECTDPVTVALSANKNVLLCGRNDGVAVVWRGSLPAERATLAPLGRPTTPTGVATKRFVLSVDGDHAIWSRVVGRQDRCRVLKRFPTLALDTSLPQAPSTPFTLLPLCGLNPPSLPRSPSTTSLTMDQQAGSMPRRRITRGTREKSLLLSFAHSQSGAVARRCSPWRVE